MGLICGIFTLLTGISMKLIADRTNYRYAEISPAMALKAGGLKCRVIVNVMASVLIMCCAGSVYAWSIFVAPLQNSFGLSTAQTQLIFGFIIASFTVTMLFVDRIQVKLGLKITASIGAVLFSAGYLLASFSGGNVIIILLGISVLSGAGMGFGYVTVLTNLVKWFPEHKGLATGIAVAGFGSGAILLSQIVQPILNHGMAVTGIFRAIGIIYGIIFLASALLISAPVLEKKAVAEKPISTRTLVKDRRFRVLCYTFFAGSFAGLMLIGNLKPIALNYGISNQAAGLSIVLLSVGNAAGRILWGQVYDKVGGKRSVGMALAFVSVLMLVLLTRIPGNIAFLVLCLVFGLGFGANFVLYASDVSQIYGIPQLGVIYPIVSIAYGISGILGPLAGGFIFDVTKHYAISIILSAAICLSGLAVYVLLMNKTARPGK
jgi:OFA family oxalate/formate antiporter-like MFS transporter